MSARNLGAILYNMGWIATLVATPSVDCYSSKEKMLLKQYSETRLLGVSDYWSLAILSGSICWSSLLYTVVTSGRNHRAQWGGKGNWFSWKGQ